MVLRPAAFAGGGEYAVAGLQAENPALDWVLPDDGGIRSMQALAVFESSERKALATEFVKWVLSPEGQAHPATSSCYWAMPANSKAALSVPRTYFTCLPAATLSPAVICSMPKGN